MPTLAAELVRRRVNVIAAGGGLLSAEAARAETRTIPILFLVAQDPIKLGLVASLNRPGGNLTGINILAAELAAKRLELMRELLPGAVRIAALVDPANAADYGVHAERTGGGCSSYGNADGGHQCQHQP